MLAWITLAYAAAWTLTAFYPHLWVVTAFAFAQNVSFTFVSRGRNSGSLAYHLVAAIFSNGIWVCLFAFSVDIVSKAGSFPVSFAIVYTLSTLSGSVFAHWLAKRFEKGKARNVQEDRVQLLERRLSVLEGNV